MTSGESENEQAAGRRVDLAAYRLGAFSRGAHPLVEILWIVVSTVLFRWCPVSLSALKRAVLRAFGAKVGRHVVIKPDVRITFPWRLRLGDNVWLGEECWILNLAEVSIGSDVCISQRAFVCTGSHDYKSRFFDLDTRPVRIEDGAWIAAGAWVGPGVRVGSHAVLTAGSVAAADLDAYGIYRGNPAQLVRERKLMSPGNER